VALSQRNSEELRGNVRFLGLLFQILAVLSLVATAFTALKVSQVETQVGFRTTSNPAILFIVLGGIMAALIFTAIGHGLGILCAIYDRQEWATREPPFKSPPHRLTTTPPSGPTTLAAITPTITQLAEKSTSEMNTQSQTQTLLNETRTAPDGLWEWLTRERHFPSRQSD
jgi:hypothetical protein